MNFHHVPVMLDEVMTYLNLRQGGTYVDCTLGGGGHTTEIIKKIQPGGRVIGIDQDPNALEAARKRLESFGSSIVYVHSNYYRLKEIFAELNLGEADGVLFDLGVSSHQLDEGERGFSYMQDAPLDMRMNPGDLLTAEQIVNEKTEDELTGIIRDYGEENWARRIARFIVDHRAKRPIHTTGELVEIIKKAVPAGARREGPHPAKRTFQALRIAVNDELNRFKKALYEAVDILRPGGRVCVISFHSLEDRIAKEVFREMAKTCVCPPGLPVCMCNKKQQVKVLTGKPVLPTQEELKANPRARSSKLRAAEKRRVLNNGEDE
ncbi:16S rRNA (cytosine(1402)-N(4))-methyltransferase RsmH [Phosphitispora fastidiosa]|uniref:16S rRNA (cytosine(1402)-N(4))-methyltransferase RsmH n=1 Tax=Phosphitispora fastidiosa TaxID=2837202 RepID=UPI001E2E3FF3|nr:16S rRNA (cytosine(1402)-N(4))-methyltransferase RsmH [Phosphitispora fastidiosa]MBU7005644.1 16S rRNA (cytosine1402-N4)-methyltransferase [Phosphitispora fastidiosa]